MGSYASQDSVILFQVDTVVGILDHEELCIRDMRCNDFGVFCRSGQRATPSGYQNFSIALTQWADPVLVSNNYKRLGRYAVETSSVIEILLVFRIEVVYTRWSVLYPNCVINRF